MFKVMFHSPRIAPNTGNAIRMVAGSGCELHLVRPLGFDLSEPKLRRAGLDYHDLASVTVHDDLPAAWDAVLPASVYAFTAHATVSFAEVAYQPGDVLMFGPEPTGLDAETLADPHITAQVRIPMLAGRRSLNLSNAAAVAVYEAWRQHGFAGAAPAATSDPGAAPAATSDPGAAPAATSDPGATPAATSDTGAV